MIFVRAALLAVLLLLPVSLPAAESKPAPGEPVYVRLKPIAFSVIGADNRLQKQVSILLDLELEQDKVDASLDPYRRKVMDAFLITLDEFYSDRKPDDPPVDGDALKEKLLQVATAITGPGIIRGVLIMSIGERGQTR